MHRKIVHIIFLLFILSIPSLAVAGMAGSPAPDFTLDTLDGRQVSLKDLRGKVVFIDFWASWCPPCKKEMPELVRFLNERSEPDFVVVAISVDKKKSHAEGFISTIEGGLPEGFFVLHDPGATVIPRYKALAMPTSFIVDRSGIVRFVHYGFNESDPAKWATEVGELLEEDGGR